MNVVNKVLQQNKIQDEVLIPPWLETKKGTIVSDLGSGKSFVALKIIDKHIKKKQRNLYIDIIVPKLSLLNTWVTEIEKYFGVCKVSEVAANYKYVYFPEPYHHFNIRITTIHSFLKELNKDKKYNPDLVILDEIHEILSEKRGKLLAKYSGRFKTVLGLTGTPQEDFKFKSGTKYQTKGDLYRKIAPIRIRYHKAEKDKLINKKKYLILNYPLSNEFSYTFERIKGNFTKGEKDAYDYIEKQIDKAKTAIETEYWNEVVNRLKIIYKAPSYISQVGKDKYKYAIHPKYRKLYKKLIDKDSYELFKRVNSIIKYKFKELYDSEDKKEISKWRGFYWQWKGIVGTNYAIFGITHFNIIDKIPQHLKWASFLYIKYIRERITFLSRASSLISYSKKIRDIILQNENNRVFLFCKYKEEAALLSPYTYYTGNKDNSINIGKFRKGEIRELASINMLGLGINMKGLNYALFHSFTSSKAKEQQKMGRLNRLSLDELAYVVFLIPQGTHTEIWFDRLGIVPDYKTENINKLLKKITIK